MAFLYHVTSRDAWTSQEGGHFTDPSLEREGFIHSSHRDQILCVANRIFAGRSDLVILCIDADLLEPEVKEEDSYGHGVYPHIFGPINRDAVRHVVAFPSGADGRFSLPERLPAE